MADKPWEKYAAQQGPWSKYGEGDAPSTSQPEAPPSDPGFFETIYNRGSEMLGGMTDAWKRGDFGAMSGMNLVDETLQAPGKFTENYKKGDIDAAVRSIPIVGPISNNIYKAMDAGHPREAMGELVSGIAPFALAKPLLNPRATVSGIARGASRAGQIASDVAGGLRGGPKPIVIGAEEELAGLDKLGRDTISTYKADSRQRINEIKQATGEKQQALQYEAARMDMEHQTKLAQIQQQKDMVKARVDALNEAKTNANLRVKESKAQIQQRLDLVDKGFEVDKQKAVKTGLEEKAVEADAARVKFGKPLEAQAFVEKSKALRETSYKLWSQKANELYDQFRAPLADPQNIRMVQKVVGVDEMGNPITAPTPVATPLMKWQHAKSSLTPLYQELQRTGRVPESLRKIMESDDFLPVKEAEQYLGELKRDTRVMFPDQIGRAKGFEKFIVKELDGLIDDALTQVKPDGTPEYVGGTDALAALKAGREAVRNQHAIHGSVVARGVTRMMESGQKGATVRVMNNPLYVKSYLEQTGVEGRSIMSGRLFQDLYKAAQEGDGVSSARWKKAWESVPETSKLTLLTDEQIKIGDSLGKPDATLKRVADAYVNNRSALDQALRHDISTHRTETRLITQEQLELKRVDRQLAAQEKQLGSLESNITGAERQSGYLQKEQSGEIARIRQELTERSEQLRSSIADRREVLEELVKGIERKRRMKQAVKEYAVKGAVGSGAAYLGYRVLASAFGDRQ